MKFCATILATTNELGIVEAIASVVEWVDSILLIDTGVSEASVAAARSASNQKLVVRQFSWCDNVSLARNFALYQANSLGADWAIPLDADERLAMRGFSSRTELEELIAAHESIRLWYVRHVDGNTAKERFIRLPVRTDQQWMGEVHGIFNGIARESTGILPGVTYNKTDVPSDVRRMECEREILQLERVLANSPQDGRSWYFLGQALQQLGRFDESLNAYRKCIDTCKTPGDYAAAAAYFAASIAVDQRDYRQALMLCGLGMARDPKWPELFWLAGFCCYYLERFSDCIIWENLAISLGHFRGIGLGKERWIYRHLPACYEAPFEVLKFAFEKLHQTDDMSTAIQLFEEAKSARLDRS